MIEIGKSIADQCTREHYKGDLAALIAKDSQFNLLDDDQATNLLVNVYLI